MTPYVTCISPASIVDQSQIMWSNGSQHDDFLNTRTGKLPDFQRIASGCFSSQPKNTHYNSNFGQVVFMKLFKNLKLIKRIFRMTGQQLIWLHPWHHHQCHRRYRMDMRQNRLHHSCLWHTNHNNHPEDVQATVVTIYPHHNRYQLVSTIFFFQKISQSQKYFVFDWVIKNLLEQHTQVRSLARSLTFIVQWSKKTDTTENNKIMMNDVKWLFFLKIFLISGGEWEKVRNEDESRDPRFYIVALSMGWW
jgi:hypothetical protein